MESFSPKTCLNRQFELAMLRLPACTTQRNSEVRGNCGPSAKGFGRPRSTWPDWVRSAAPLQSPRGAAPLFGWPSPGFRFLSGGSLIQAVRLSS